MYITEKYFKNFKKTFTFPISITDGLYTAANYCGTNKATIVAHTPNDYEKIEIPICDFEKIEDSEYAALRNHCSISEATVMFEDYFFLADLVFSELQKMPANDTTFYIFVYVDGVEYYLPVSSDVLNIIHFGVFETFNIPIFYDRDWFFVSFIEYEHYTTIDVANDVDYTMSLMDKQVFDKWVENSYKKLKKSIGNFFILEIYFERMLNYLFDKIKL